MQTKLLIDDREKKVSVHSEEFKNIAWTVQRITTGDYLVLGGDNIIACIERKELKDFAASIKDNRYRNVEHMDAMRRATGCRLIYIVEGPLSPLLTDEFAGFPYKVIESAMFHLAARDAVCVFKTRDTLDTARFLTRFVESMKTLKEYEPMTALPEFATVGADELAAMVAIKHVKSDVDIVRAMWSAFGGISVTSADNYIRCWSLADIICGRISREQICAFKLHNGHAINKKVANNLMAVSKPIETRILSQVPQISNNAANYILLRMSLSELINKDIGALQQVASTDKKKINKTAAENIVRLFEYKGIS